MKGNTLGGIECISYSFFDMVVLEIQTYLYGYCELNVSHYLNGLVTEIILFIRVDIVLSYFDNNKIRSVEFLYTKIELKGIDSSFILNFEKFKHFLIGVQGRSQNISWWSHKCFCHKARS